MKYKEFTVETTTEAEDLIADIFWKYTDYGVSISSGAEVDELIEKRGDTFDYIDEKLLEKTDNKSFVKGSFPLESAEEDFKKVQSDIDALKENSGGFLELGSLAVTTRVFDNDEWIDNWRKFFKPIEFEKVCIRPSWVEYNGDKTPVIIGTDLAFGTGEHETTSMCIDFLEAYLKGGETVFDVGTGSGILGIVAAKLGAERVYMTDNDPEAVKAAIANVSANGISESCFPILSNLADDLVGSAELVVANITAEILCMLSEDIDKYLKSGGTLIMSGILNDRVEKVVNAYAAKGFELVERKSTGEWSAVVMRKI